MEEVIRQLLERDLADFEGLEVRGSVPVRTELVNQLITAFLNAPEKEASPETPGEETIGEKKKVSLPIPTLKRMVRRAAIRAEDGKIIFDFEIRR